MKLRTLGLNAFLLSAAVSGHAQQKVCAPTVMGELHVEQFLSETFHDTQTLRVWLPPGYHDAAQVQRKYPVLYMLDGQNLFDACTSSFHSEWQIDETLTRLIEEGKVEPIIVVGIDSLNIQRAEEYLPFSDGVFGEGKPVQGAKFPAFLANEVLPRIGREFRVQTGREHTGVGGSSYGSVAALYALLERPDVFGLGLLESTSVQAGNGELIRRTRSLILPPLRVSIGVGTEETGVAKETGSKLGLTVEKMNRLLPWGSQQIADNLKNTGADASDVKLTVTVGARHEEKAWAARFPAAVEFLFPAK